MDAHKHTCMHFMQWSNNLTGCDSLLPHFSIWRKHPRIVHININQTYVGDGSKTLNTNKTVFTQ